MLAVVIIIGILSALAYASLMELIFTNRAKETAQTMRTFAERALAEGKRIGSDVTISLNGSSIQYTIAGNTTPISEPLNGGYNKAATTAPNCVEFAGTDFATGVTSEFRIGLSGITEEGYFAVCGGRDYCAAAVKTKSNNSFIACIKKRGATDWEVL